MNYLVLPRLQRCHIRGREWKIIGYLVTESTLKTTARAMKSTDSTSVAVLPADSEPFWLEVYIGSLEQSDRTYAAFMM